MPRAPTPAIQSGECDLVGDIYSRLDLDDPEFNPASDLFSLPRKASVFLSYTRDDRAIANRVRLELKQHDFGVFPIWNWRRARTGEARIEAELEKAVLQRAVIIFINSRSVWECSG